MSKYELDFFVSWEELHKTGRRLAKTLHEIQEWKGILCVTRGGMVPTAIIARELNIRLIDTICITSYDGQSQGEFKLNKAPDIANDGEGWLIIDDLVDTGKTAAEVRRHYPKAHFATLYAKPAGLEFVDSYVEAVTQNTWIRFPWDMKLSYADPIVKGG
ncbi:xanthine phosphoribosyltransferase [Litoribacillus peritrichatus]|uniref:Xanthine phosphoribosyltransferase n=1 Tax=Litoribacillus peritrichatus TaxID=718191 RepID=A0ABP7MPX2_9GAMM